MEQSSARHGPYEDGHEKFLPPSGRDGSSAANREFVTVTNYNLQIGPSQRTSDLPSQYYPPAMKSGISGLNLGQALFSEGEPNSAAIIK